MKDERPPTRAPARLGAKRQRGANRRRANDFAPGDRVRLSAAGKARLAQMPEAWGMHTAAARDEVGTVIEVIEGDEANPLALSVEFASGAVYNWDADQFEPA